VPLVRSISKRFLPNKQESIDHAPGPSIATLTDSTASKTWIQVCSCREWSHKAIQPSSRAASVPITGVHRPAIRKTPAPAAIKSGTRAIASDGFAESAAMAKQIRAIPRQLRSRSRPTPGQLFGKVENRRCRAYPNSIVWRSRWRSIPPIERFGFPCSRDVLFTKAR
jgi:hypothetical protein